MKVHLKYEVSCLVDTCAGLVGLIITNSHFRELNFKIILSVTDSVSLVPHLRIRKGYVDVQVHQVAHIIEGFVQSVC